MDAKNNPYVRIVINKEFAIKCMSAPLTYEVAEDARAFPVKDGSSIAFGPF
jgi:hypothetical protein